MLSWLLKFDDKKQGSPSDSVYELLAVKLRVLLAGYTVTMVTFCVKKMISTC